MTKYQSSNKNDKVATKNDKVAEKMTNLHLNFLYIIILEFLFKTTFSQTYTSHFSMFCSHSHTQTTFY